MEAALDQPVLVLNRLWQAVNVIGARRAFGLLARGHAHVVHQQEDDFRMFSMMDWIDFSADHPTLIELEMVHTPTRTIRLPRVILLTFFDKLPSKELKLTRNNVFERDKNSCQYCAKALPREQLNLDHVIPRDYGGKTTWENIVCSCIKCNSRKANRLPHEAGMRLIASPRDQSGGPSSRWCLATSTARCGRTSSILPIGTSSWRSSSASCAPAAS